MPSFKRSIEYQKDLDVLTGDLKSIFTKSTLI